MMRIPLTLNTNKYYTTGDFAVGKVSILYYLVLLWPSYTPYVWNQHLRSVAVFGITSVSLHSDLLISAAGVSLYCLGKSLAFNLDRCLLKTLQIVQEIRWRAKQRQAQGVNADCCCFRTPWKPRDWTLLWSKVRRGCTLTCQGSTPFYY